MTDKRIAALMLTSPETGLQEAVLQYSAYVLKICRIKLSGICSEEDIEEAVSDVFFKFYTYCKSSSRKLNTARGLISVIAARHCNDMLRKKYRSSDTVSLEDLDKEISDPGGFGEGDYDLACALHRLGSKDEEIFLRKYFYGQKSSEIAYDMGLKTNTVDKRISRGLEKLRTFLKEDD